MQTLLYVSKKMVNVLFLCITASCTQRFVSLINGPIIGMGLCTYSNKSSFITCDTIVTSNIGARVMMN